mgnify:CR=1 FL=1
MNLKIDLVFNKGPKALNDNLIANLEHQYYHSAALRTWYDTSNKGLQKRNMYRFLEAISDLNVKEQISAIERFKKEHVTQLAAVFSKDNDAKIAWNKTCNKVHYDDGLVV